MDCLNEKALSSYLDERPPEAERRSIEEHISGCSRCLDLLVLAYEAGRGGFKHCPPLLRRRIRERLGLKEKRHPELKWLFGAMFLFVLSFVFRRFFLQFLAGAAILGFKWVMEGEGARRVVMIFKGMHKEEDSLVRK